MEQTKTPVISRRRLLGHALAGAAAMALSPIVVSARPAPMKKLSFVHTHTNEHISLAYAREGRYLPEAMARLSRYLRDFRTGDVHPLDPRLFDLLHALHRAAEGKGAYHVISGYRSPQTNTMLRLRGSSGVAQKSLHMLGQAIDVRLPGVRTSRLRDLAIDLGRGGVGYYGKSDFIHLDTGRVRCW